jgi:hypothetical protein
MVDRYSPPIDRQVHPLTGKVGAVSRPCGSTKRQLAERKSRSSIGAATAAARRKMQDKLQEPMVRDWVTKPQEGMAFLSAPTIRAQTNGCPPPRSKT